MGKLYLTCLLLLAVAGSIQCSAIGAEIKPENEEVGIGGGSCGPGMIDFALSTYSITSWLL